MADNMAEHVQALHTPVNSAFSGKRVLITGGAGFVGSHIADLAVEAGAREVVIIDNMVRGRMENLHAALPTGRITAINGDIRDTALLTGQVKGADIVFHQAALRITHCAAEPRAAIEVMIDSTFELVEACRLASVEKVVMASSASVYGIAHEFPTTEFEPSVFKSNALRCCQDLRRGPPAILQRHVRP